MKKLTASCCLAALLLLGACVPDSQYDSLEQEYQQLQVRLAGDNVRLTRMQGAIKLAINNELLFPSGGWEMPADAKQLIARIAPVLAPIQQTPIQVNGFTDDVPIGEELKQRGITTNVQLSYMRAQNVANFLISQGVNPSLLQVQGYGDAYPIASNNTPQGRAQNRRVELTIAGTGQ